MKKITSAIVLVAVASLLFFSCEKKSNVSAVSETGASLPYSTLTKLDNGTEVRNGGFGSGATAHPEDANMFYAMTDRGPNATYKGEAGKGKKFPAPDYTPRIGLYSVGKDGKVSLVKEILFKDPSGKAISGRPNPEGKGATGEVPYDNDGKVLEYDDYGLDSEGLAAAKNGEFWVSDEYGPHIVHYDAEGKELERISPVNVNKDNGGRKIPAVFERRRPNRGMEGLAITPDQKMLVGMMQSTLYNPSKKEAVNTTLVRIITFNLENGETKEYLYKQEKAWNSNSEIAALTNSTFLVVERDGKFSGAGEAQKHIYKIDLKDAIDVSGDFESMDGKLVDGKTLEQCTWEELASAGFKPVNKELVCDLVKTLPNHYPHEKLEGIIIIDKNTFAVLNDDDFAVSVKDGEVIQKELPGTNGQIDSNTLYVIKVNKALW